MLPELLRKDLSNKKQGGNKESLENRWKMMCNSGEAAFGQSKEPSEVEHNAHLDITEPCFL